MVCYKHHVTTLTRLPAEQKSIRAAAYQRISLDKAGDEHGVGNQLADQRRLAASRGYAIVRTESDNDISATNGRSRPGYKSLMAAAARGEFDVIIVFQTSRLWRNRRERAEGIEILRNAGVSVVATKGPSLDMSTAYGRAMAGLLGEFDTMEAEVKSERQQLAEQSAARAGIRRKAGPRALGWLPDRVTLDPAESGAIRWAADALLGGTTVTAVAEEWNRRGLRSVHGGGLFRRQSVLAVMRNPRLAGIRAYKGEIVSEEPGGWEPVLSRAQWEAVDALLADPARRPSQPGVRRLLGNMARCHCGNIVTGSGYQEGHLNYRCRPESRDGRAGPHATVRSEPVDFYVSEVMIARLSRDDVAGLITPAPGVDTGELNREAASLRKKMEADAVDEMKDVITRAQLIARKEYALRRLAEIGDELAASSATSVLAPFTQGNAAREVWDSLDLPRKRAVIAELCTVTLLPAGQGVRTFNPDKVQINWRKQ